MGDADLPSLLAEQRNLVIEESVILNLLKTVREEMRRINIESLELESMTTPQNNMSDDDVSVTSTIDLDSAEKVNREQLDLGVSALSNMVEGKFFVGKGGNSEEEEEDEDEEDNDIDEEDEEEVNYIHRAQARALRKHEFILRL